MHVVLHTYCQSGSKVGVGASFTVGWLFVVNALRPPTSGRARALFYTQGLCLYATGWPPTVKEAVNQVNN